MGAMRILIVEDEKDMAHLLKVGLEEENHIISLTFDGPSGLELARSCDFDVILLDVMLPKLDGFEVARRLRADGNRTPILMLTARDNVPDVVKGLDLGADDYLTKPFSFAVLLARLRAASRRKYDQPSSVLRVADLELDRATRAVTRAKREINLTATEFRLLEFLMRRPGVVVSRNTIVDAVWGFDDEVNDNTVDAFIRLLRRKVDDPYEMKLIKTVRGVGYSLRAGS
jgi:DNA-binding response OmpR family regulator